MASLASYGIVPAAPGYGLYSSNVYLSGKIIATTGVIGSGGNVWTIDADSIYTGTEHLGDDWSTTGITLANDGSIHAPNFYVNTGGEIGLRQVESVLFKIDTDTAMKILGSHIWEHNRDIENSKVYINWYGYNGGNTRYRTTVIGDGKAHSDFQFIGAVTSEARFDANMTIGSDAQPSYTLDVYGDVYAATDKAGSWVAKFFNDGNNINRYGIEIKCGEDVPAGENIPVKFLDGDGTTHSSIRYDNNDISFGAVSDVRLKENIRDYNIDGLSIINQMQYRSFNWKRDSAKQESRGWVADEVEKIFPEMVVTDKESGYKMILRERLIPVMMSAIKELNEKIKKLESN
ncbi:MAG TPA: tail fiber domain-containing protein [bacterium]|nr:tail fiber domain-containing protein [bacterium]